MQPTFPLPPDAASALRELFADPARVGAGVQAEAAPPLLELARALTGAERVGLRLRDGQGFGELPPDLHAAPGAGELEGQPAWIAALEVPLLPDGSGPRAGFGALALSPPPAPEAVELATRQVATCLLQQAVATAQREALEARSARKLEQGRALLEAVDAVARLAPLPETLTAVVDRCVAVTGAMRGLLLEHTEEGWQPRVARGRDGRDLPQPRFASTVASEAREAGRAVHHLLEDEPEAAISPSASELELRAVLCAPLRGEDVPDGVVYVDSTETGRFDPATLAFFGALVDQLSLALRNAALYDRLRARHLQLRDDLAGREAELAQVRGLLAQQLGDGARSARYEELLGRSPAMQQIFDQLSTLEGSDVPVVIQGESGTGKELIARAIHRRSRRAQGPWVAVNAAAIPEQVFESEMFGHAKGAFTGAHGQRTGLLEEADGGTLFLDEVGELSLDSQAKLLRVLQEGEVRRVGDARPRPVDVRILAASNRDLRAMLAEGSFREDLYYRLAVFRIALPPLRERAGDLPLLVEHLLQAFPCAGISPAALRTLSARRWPGNVRQLRNALERAATLAGSGTIEPEHVLDDEPAALALPAEAVELPLREARQLFNLHYARRAVAAADGSIAAAARAAGVTRQTLYRALAEGEALEQRLARGEGPG